MTDQALTLLAIHGNGGGGFRFTRVQPFLPPNIHWLTPTLPGFGGQPADPSITALSHFAEYIWQNLTAAPPPWVVLGTGIGGSIALELAQRHATELAGLILHAPVGARLEKRLFPRLLRPPAMRRLGQRLIASPLLRPAFRQLLFRQPLPTEIEAQFFAGYNQASAFSQMFDLITPQWFASLQPIPTPTALLWGGRERVLTVDQLADYQHLLPNHQVHIEPDWDHFPMLEQPAHYAQVIAKLAQNLILQPNDQPQPTPAHL